MVRRIFALGALFGLVAGLAEPIFAQPVGPVTTVDAMLAGESSLPPAELAKRIAAAQDKPLGSIGNPVRAELPEGERAYLARLRCANGKPPEIGQRGDVGEGVYGNFIDLFPLDCGASAPGKVALHMDMYHKGHVEKVAPPGFGIVDPSP